MNLFDNWTDGVAVIVRPGDYDAANTATNGDLRRRQAKSIRGGAYLYGTRAIIDIPGAIDKGLTTLAGDALDALIERGIHTIRTRWLGADLEWFAHACEHAGVSVDLIGDAPTPAADPCTWSECDPALASERIPDKAPWMEQVDQFDRPLWEPMNQPEPDATWFDPHDGSLLHEKDRPDPEGWAMRRKVKSVSKLMKRDKPSNGRLATIVTGDRLLDGMEWYVTVATAIQPYHVVISGGAKGADSMAEDACKARNDVQFIKIKARWDELGKRAGYERNREMLNKLLNLYYEGYDIDVHAFHTDLFNSKGTKMMVDLALEKGIRVTLHDVQDEPADSTPAFISTHQSIVEAAQPVLNYTPAF
jgi:hypothetical protein